MSTRTQWVCVPWIESRSRPNVVESSFWMAPPTAMPNTSEPKVFPDGVEVVPVEVVPVEVVPVEVVLEEVVPVEVVPLEIVPVEVVPVDVVPVLVEPPPLPPLACLAARARRASALRHARRRLARVLAECARAALRRQRVSAVVFARAVEAVGAVEVEPAAAVAVRNPARRRAIAPSTPSGRAKRADGRGRMDWSPSAAGLSRKAETPGFATPPHDGCAVVGNAPTRRALFVFLGVTSTAAA